MAERSAAATAALVLATINAPHKERLDTQGLARCLSDHAAAKAKPGHMSCFFGELTPDLQVAFAHLVGITQAELVAAAKAFALYSGQSYPLAER
jgi:hypothetical protein